MKFLILASLFVLSVVAEPEAEPQHHTAGFTAYTNGALVPQDTDSVKAAKIQHLTAKAALYAQPMPLKYYQPHVYGVQHQQLIQVPRVGYPAMKVYTGYPTTTAYTGYPATTAYTGYPTTTAYTGYPTTTAYKGYPYTYNTLPALRHIGKREAEAEPEAEAEAEAQYMNYYRTPASTYPVTYGYPTAYTGYPAMKVYTGYPTTTAYTGYPATTAYTGYPTTTAYTGYPAITAYKGYPYTYNTLPTTTFNTAYNRYPYTYGTYGYNPYKIVQTPVVKN